MDAHAQFVADDNQLVVFLQQEFPFVFGHLQGGLHIAAVVVKNICKPEGNAVEQHGALFQGDASQVLFLLHGGPLWTPVALVALDALAKVLVPVPGRGQIHRLLAACFGQLLGVGTLAGTLSPADKGDCHRFLVLRKSRVLCRCTAPGIYRTDNQILGCLCVAMSLSRGTRSSRARCPRSGPFGERPLRCKYLRCLLRWRRRSVKCRSEERRVGKECRVWWSRWC